MVSMQPWFTCSFGLHALCSLLLWVQFVNTQGKVQNITKTACRAAYCMGLLSPNPALYGSVSVPDQCFCREHPDLNFVENTLLGIFQHNSKIMWEPLSGALWRSLGLFGIIWGCLGLSRVVRDCLGLSGTLCGTDWDSLGLSGTLWVCLSGFLSGPSGTVWECLRLSVGSSLAVWDSL